MSFYCTIKIQSLLFSYKDWLRESNHNNLPKSNNASLIGYLFMFIVLTRLVKCHPRNSKRYKLKPFAFVLVKLC